MPEVPLDSEGFHPFGELIGLEFTEVESGYSRSRLTIEEKHFNPTGIVHGGVMYSMADTGMGAAVYVDLDSGENCSTVELKISYHESVDSGVLTCETEVVEERSRLVFLESEVFHDHDCVARANGTFSIQR